MFPSFRRWRAVSTAEPGTGCFGNISRQAGSLSGLHRSGGTRIGDDRTADHCKRLVIFDSGKCIKSYGRIRRRKCPEIVAGDSSSSASFKAFTVLCAFFEASESDAA